MFLDDRPDELERVGSAYPELTALDATDPVTWRLLARWRDLLPPDPDEDRTRLYRERVERERFVGSRPEAGARAESPAEDESAALHDLGLSVTLKAARGSDLKRVVELINRTNQFNLCGTRTTLREIQEGLGATRSVVTAEASDKFGGMGVVGVMVADWVPGRVEVPIFVLSCRVFGFGIERALLHALKTAAPDGHALVGHARDTQFNAPGRTLYPDAGLTWDGRQWLGRTEGLPSPPPWLAVRGAVERPGGA